MTEQAAAATIALTAGVIIGGILVGILTATPMRCVYHFKDSNGTMQHIGSVCHESWWRAPATLAR